MKFCKKRNIFRRHPATGNFDSSSPSSCASKYALEPTDFCIIVLVLNTHTTIAKASKNIVLKHCRELRVIQNKYNTLDSDVEMQNFEHEPSTQQ